MLEQAVVRAQWEGDVLQRKPIGDFVYRLLVAKYLAMRSSPDAGALSFALDAGWGRGKTFFISRWARDIEACDHPVVVFDAWKNDLTEEPLLGFIATLRNGLRGWTKKLPIAVEVKRELMRSVQAFTKRAGRAVVPTIAVVTKGAIKKLSGVGVDELVEAWGKGDELEQTDQTSGAANRIADEAIDKFFSLSLEGHSKRLEAINEFKAAIIDMLERLESRASAKLPMFVFIDELDRCRPNYAIELLEGVKHLFDVPGICFCVSTNLPQLSESIKGVYGGGFDARMYLKRFFAFEYRLPDPDHVSFAQLLALNSIFLQRKILITGLSDWAETKKPEVGAVARSFAFVADSFQLSLRSQQQVFAVAEAACAGIPEHRAVHILFLFSLAALLHVDAEGFDNIASRNVAPTEFLAAFQRRIPKGSAHAFTVVIHNDRSFHAEKQIREVNLVQLLQEYFRLADKDLKEIHKEFYGGNSREYPNSIRQTIADEMPSSYRPGDQYPTSISKYAALVRAAGQVVEVDTP